MLINKLGSPEEKKGTTVKLNLPHRKKGGALGHVKGLRRADERLPENRFDLLLTSRNLFQRISYVES